MRDFFETSSGFIIFIDGTLDPYQTRDMIYKEKGPYFNWQKDDLINRKLQVQVLLDPQFNVYSQ